MANKLNDLTLPYELLFLIGLLALVIGIRIDPDLVAMGAVLMAGSSMGQAIWGVED